jgi:branched-chain amino acid transport system substrate-binding protein
VLSRRQMLLGTAAAAAAAGAPARRAGAQQPAIRIGEINSYSGVPAFTLPYRNGWQLAVDEINAGGVLGRRLEVISRDDAGRPGDAITAANGLVANERVVLLAGTFFSHIGLAVADFARQRKVLFVAAEPLTDALVWEQGNRYTFRLRPSTYMQSAMLVEEAAKLPAKRWATVAPNYEYGQAAVAAFRKLLGQRRRDVEWVAEQWPAQGKIDAGATIQALAQARPEAVFNVTFAGDLARLVREGNTVGFFKGRSVVSLLTGEPEYLDPLGAEAPEGWIVTGYPWYDIKTPEHQRFVAAYREKFNDSPRLGSLVGYNTFKAIGAALARAGSTDTERLVGAMKGLSFDSPAGPITFRPSDHQSTMGAWVGKTAVRDGKGVMVDWRYADGKSYLPDEKTVAALRPAS